jgi:hypothetical protein
MSPHEIDHAIASGLSFDQAVSRYTLEARDRALLAAARSMFPELGRRGRRRGRDDRRVGMPAVPGVVSPSVAMGQLRPASPSQPAAFEPSLLADGWLEHYFPEVAARRHRRRSHKRWHYWRSPTGSSPSHTKAAA